VDIAKVNLSLIEPWITKRTTELLSLEDDILVQYIMGLLQAEEGIDPRVIQIRVAPFLYRKAAPFVSELWSLLLDAQKNPGGIPTELLERTKAVLQKKRVRTIMLFAVVCSHRFLL